MESEETQDYVREANDMDQEEGEEISFVPSAISVLQKPLFRCDNQCREKTLSFYTTNLCQKCYNESLDAKGDKTLRKWQWYEFLEKKGASWKAVENDGKRTIRTRNVGILLPRKSKS